MSHLFASDGQSIGALSSALALPMNIQGWLPLGLTGLISLMSKGLSSIFSSTTVQKHQFFNAQPFFIFQLLHLRVQLWRSAGFNYRSSTRLGKQRHNFANKDLYDQSNGFSISHIWMWVLDHKEGWALKNWSFWNVVLEKTLESPLDIKEIKAVNPKGKQAWIFIGRTDAEAEPLIL